MKRICIALCLSLFASLIHAAMMPIELSANQSHRACNRSVSRLTHSGPTVFNQRVDPTLIAVKQTLVRFAELKLLQF